MRAADRNARTPNHAHLTPAQRRLVELVRQLRRAQRESAGQTQAEAALGAAVAQATWGPFGAFFITISRPYWAGIDHDYRTLWSNRRPVIMVRLWADGTHSLVKCYSPAEGEEYFLAARGKRREHAAQAAEHARRVRRIIGRATPAQRAAMRAAALKWRGEIVVRRDAAGNATAWFQWGTISEAVGETVEYLPAHNAVLSCIKQDEAERFEREAARARAAGVARIGRAVAEAAWQAVCLAREAEALEAVRGLRRIHA